MGVGSEHVSNDSTAIVLIVGPRRAGKTTLVRKMDDESHRYITLDDQTVLAAAQSDPAGFVRGLDRAIIDEIQRAPELLRNRCSGPTLPSPS
ncbi:AAA family ATPase [Rhizobium leguminosarum bv. viciae]|nr:AAA family ATPase [Rhizobium leguminosarum bv. viciae]